MPLESIVTIIIGYFLINAFIALKNYFVLSDTVDLIKKYDHDRMLPGEEDRFRLSIEHRVKKDIFYGVFSEVYGLLYDIFKGGM